MTETLNTKDLNIYLDLDDVIFNWNLAYAKYFNIGLPVSWDDNPNMSSHLNILSKDKLYWLGLPVKNRPNFQPKGFVSARGIPKTWTKESLKINNIPGRSNVHQVGWGQSKIDLLKKLQTDIFIDDKYATFKDCHKNNIFCLLMDAPHNQKYKTKYRIYTLDINIILEKYNEWLK